MSGLGEMCRRARDRAGAPVRGLHTIADYVRPGYATSQPYVCHPGGHLITRLHRPQSTAIEARRTIPCTRRGCGGALYATTWEREGRRLRELLRLAADTIHPSPRGLDLIRNRIGGAPLHGGTAAHDDDLGSPTP